MNNLIAHALVRNPRDKILIIRRTMIKRGKENFEGGKWDIPGGTVEELEFPSVASERGKRRSKSWCCCWENNLWKVKFRYKEKQGIHYIDLFM